MNKSVVMVIILMFVCSLNASIVKLPKLKKNVAIVNQKILNLSGEPNNAIAISIVKNVDRKDWDTVIAICWVESRFRPRTISPTHDYGLMGINKPTWQKVYTHRFNNLLQINENVIFGYSIYKMYRDSSLNHMDALLKYNGGGRMYPFKIYTAIRKMNSKES